MGIIEKRGALGGFRNEVGTLVGSSWRGKDVIVWVKKPGLASDTKFIVKLETL